MKSVDLELIVDSVEGRLNLHFTTRRLICSGWVGRDKDALQDHIDELSAHGVPGPTRTPIFMNFSLNLLTTSDSVDVISPHSSGEVEFVILKSGNQMFIGVGSDETDRGFEKHSIPASKQMYPKIMAPVVWPYQEVQDHWDRIVLRSWMTSRRKKELYQEDALSSIMTVDALLKELPKEDGLPTDGMVIFSGTIGTRKGIVFGQRFDMEMEDPVLNRSIRYGYDVRVLPQYI